MHVYHDAEWGVPVRDNDPLMFELSYFTAPCISLARGCFSQPLPVAAMPHASGEAVGVRARNGRRRSAAAPVGDVLARFSFPPHNAHPAPPIFDFIAANVFLADSLR